ncbi:MAG: polysaccharide biosynthesis/export family protein [Aridibacter famidurans]|nr:polysaccharide biosynthesis/export family protein [Aridibacter famidurans]
MYNQKPAAAAILFLFASILLCVPSVTAQEVAENPAPAKTDPAGGPVELPDGRTVAPNLDRYRIGFEDVIQVTVFRHPELSQTMSVAQDGTIVLPRIDRPIVAVCKTERELADLVTELYKNYLRNPFVNVRAIEQRSQPFAVIGAVNKPGSFFLDRRIRLLELLAMAGGPDVEKSGQRIRVARVGSRSACVDDDTSAADVEFIAYNVNDVLGGEVNPWMRPGDIVSVLEAEEAFIVGAVYEPSKITLKEPITLMQAIAKAGGVDKATAKTGKVKILRQQEGTTVKTELVFDLEEIAEKRVEDPVIQGNDIIEVPTDNGKVLKNGIFKVLAGGLGNLFYRFPL